MKKIAAYLKPYALQSVLAPLFKLFEVLLELAVPLVIADLVDTGIAGGDRSVVLSRCLLLVGAPLLGFLCASTAQYFAANASAGFASGLRKAVFRHLQSLPFASLDALGVPTMLTRMTTDMNQIQTGLNMGLRLLLRSPFVVFGAMVMAFTVDARCALLFAVAIPLLSVIAFFLLLAGMPRIRSAQKKLDLLTARARDDLNGVRVIRALGIEDREAEAFTAATGELADAQTLSARLSCILNPLTSFTVNLCVALLVWTGALRVDAGILTAGQVLALYNYMSQILVELLKLANLVITLSKGAAAADRVAALLELPAEETAQEEDICGYEDFAAAFEDVSFSYNESSDPVLEHLSFSVKPGQTVGIIGGTGAGKSTLAALLPGFYLPTAGRVFVNGRDTRCWDLEQLRQTVSLARQKPFLFSGTIADNLRMGKPDATREQMLEALDLACAAELAQREGGLEAPVEAAGRNLSGGQKQRLSVARALLSRAPLLILDDSSSALDAATDARLRRNLKSLLWRPTVFIIAQRIASVREADLILVLEDGRLAGAGTHEELLRDCPEYRETVSSQTAKEVTA